jgi:hypothetical protein
MILLCAFAHKGKQRELLETSNTEGQSSRDMQSKRSGYITAQSEFVPRSAYKFQRSLPPLADD